MSRSEATADRDRLRGLADDSARSEGWYTAACLADVLHTVATPTIARRDAAFAAAASPSAILALLDALQAAERERDEERPLATVRGEMLTAIEEAHDEMVSEIEAVHAELRALFPERPIVNMVSAVRDALRERDEARIQHAKDTHDLHVAVADLSRSLEEARARLVESEHMRRVAEEGCVEARAERDAWPEITPEDAAHWYRTGRVTYEMADVLRAHARKAVKP